MGVNTNIAPYFDDFDESKNFYKVLFRPGVSLQTRELNQLQTILQNQISKFGSHIFEEGAKVIGGDINVDYNYHYVKLQPKQNGVNVNVNAFLDTIITGSITSIQAKVIAVLDATTNNPPTLFIKYLTGGDPTNKFSKFSPAEVLTNNSTTPISATIAVESDSVGDGTSVTISQGIFFVKGVFVYTNNQTIILDNYSKYPSYQVGFQVYETISTPELDSSLNDNATGSSNQYAPGAHRYKIQLKLTKYALDTLHKDFVELLRIDNGVIQSKVVTTQYSEIEKLLARRTYDESGDYVVNKFEWSIKETRNNLMGYWQSSYNYYIGDIVRVVDRYYQALSNGVSGTTTPVHTYKEGSVTDGGVYWKYISNNMAEVPFNNGIDITNSMKDDDNFTLIMGPGKAYVRGYEIEKLSNTSIKVPKSRATRSVSGVIAPLTVGNYILIDSTTTIGMPNIAQYQTLYIFDGSDILVGSLKTKYYEHNSDTTYKLSIFDVKLNNGKIFETDARKFADTTTFSSSAIKLLASENSTKVYESNNNSLVYLLPDSGVSAQSHITYSTKKYYESLCSDVAKLTFTTENVNYKFTSNTVNDYVLYNKDTGVKTTITSVTPNVNSVEISGTFISGNTYQIIANIVKIDSIAFENHKTKTIKYSEYYDLTTLGMTTGSVLKLNKADVVRINKVLMANAFGAFVETGSVDITHKFVLDNGQRDSYYDIASIKLKPTDNYLKVTGTIRVYFDYFEHSDGGDYFCVNSYISSIPYKNIPAYVSPTDGSIYQLRDCLDFRPTISASDNTQFAHTSAIPVRGTFAQLNYDHFLKQKFLVSLSYTGEFIITQSTPAVVPSEPSVPADSMPVLKIALNPYIFSLDEKNISIEYVDNRRYTMRDIGRIEKRIQSLEYYTSLSLLELKTKSLQVYDENGFDRFKTGIFVDSFKDLSSGDIKNPDYKCSIDIVEQTLRPITTTRQVALIEKINTDELRRGNNYVIHKNNVASLVYTETDLIVQDKSSRTININPFARTPFKGTIKLYPDTDTWFEDSYKSDKILDPKTGTVSSNAVATGLPVTTLKYGSEETSWSGKIITSDKTVSKQDGSSTLAVKDVTTLTQTVNAITTVNKSENVLVGDKILEKSTAYFIRPRTVMFKATGMRPYANLNAYFDDFDVTSYCHSVTKYVLGDNIVNTEKTNTARFITDTLSGSDVEEDFRKTSRWESGFAVNKNSYIVYGSNYYKAESTGITGNIAPIHTTGTITDGNIDWTYVSSSPANEVIYTHGEVLEVTRNGSVVGTAVAVHSENDSTGYSIYVVNVKGNGTDTINPNDVVNGKKSGAIYNISSIETYDDIISTSSGNVIGIFNIPYDDSVKFLAGKKKFSLSSNSFGGLSDGITSSSVGYYTSAGTLLYRQKSIQPITESVIISDVALPDATKVSILGDNTIELVPPTPPVEPPPPVLPTVNLQITNIDSYGKCKLIWTSTNATSLSLSGSNLDATDVTTTNGLNGYEVTPIPGTTTFYSIIATNVAGSVSSSVGISAPIKTPSPDAIILTFTYISTGGPNNEIRLFWTQKNCTKTVIRSSGDSGEFTNTSEIDVTNYDPSLGFVTTPKIGSNSTVYTIQGYNSDNKPSEILTTVIGENPSTLPTVLLYASDISEDGSVTLEWVKTNVDTLTITGTNKNYPFNGIYPNDILTITGANNLVTKLSEGTTSTFTLTGYNSNGKSSQATATITRPAKVYAPLPIIKTFLASVNPVTDLNKGTTLNWVTENSVYVNISNVGEKLDASGNVTIYPVVTTNYIITAYNSDGKSATQTLQVAISGDISTSTKENIDPILKLSILNDVAAANSAITEHGKSCTVFKLKTNKKNETDFLDNSYIFAGVYDKVTKKPADIGDGYNLTVIGNIGGHDGDPGWAKGLGIKAVVYNIPLNHSVNTSVVNFTGSSNAVPNLATGDNGVSVQKKSHSAYNSDMTSYFGNNLSLSSYTTTNKGCYSIYTNGMTKLPMLLGISLTTFNEKITYGKGKSNFWYDPIAQSFLVEKTCFVTGLSLYFATRPDNTTDDNLPVSVEIRTMVNGYPSNNIVAKTTLDSINVKAPIYGSTKSSGKNYLAEGREFDDYSVTGTDVYPTKFVFDSPVYLEEGEYAFVVVSDSIKYQLWSTKIGDSIIGTDLLLTKQPYTGNLFRSENASTWIPSPLEDIKFKMHYAKFATNVSANIPLQNRKLDGSKLKANPIHLTNNSKLVRVAHQNHDLNVGDKILLDGLTDIHYNYITSDELKSGNLLVTNVDEDYYVLEAISVAGKTVDIGGGFNQVISYGNIKYNRLKPVVELQEFNETPVKMKISTTNLSKNSDTLREMDINSYIDYSEEKIIYSGINETTSIIGRKSIDGSLTFYTTNPYLSPMINMNRLAATLEKNIINLPNIAMNVEEIDSNIIVASADASSLTFNAADSSISSSVSDTKIKLSNIDIGKYIKFTDTSTPVVTTDDGIYLVTDISRNSAGFADGEKIFVTKANQDGILIGGVLSNTTHPKGELIQYENYIDEISPTQSSASTKYITNKVVLQQSTTSLKIILGIDCPPDADVIIYHKTLPASSTEIFENIPYVRAYFADNSGFIKVDDGKYYETSLLINNLPEFNTFQIKIVFTSTNPAKVPVIKDLRVIALA